MVSKENLLDILPFREQIVMTEERQNTDDIRKEILLAHRDYAPDYELIYSYFDQGDIIETSRGIFDFLKANVPYKKENGRYQTVKCPAAILTFNKGNTNYDRIDCKNYAAFIAGVLDRLKQHEPGSDWDWCYRFASYDENDPEPGHVFVVVKIGEKELWIDPVFAYFNAGMMHDWELDQKPVKSIGGLYRISGPGDGSKQWVVVNTKEAARSFLVAVELNLFALPELLVSYPAITDGPVKQILLNAGVDLNILNAVLTYALKR